MYGGPVDYISDFCISYSLSESIGLSNGDKITLKWDVNDDVISQLTNAKVEYSDITVEVTGLTEVEKFDAFEGLEVKFTGMNKNGEAEIIGGRSELFYVIDEDKRLSNGDVVTVSLGFSSDVDYLMEEFGALPLETEKQFTVNNLPSYVKSYAEIDETTNVKLDEYSKEIIKDYINNYFDNPADGFADEAKLNSVYFQVLEPNSFGVGYNWIGLIYEMKAKDVSTDKIFNYYYYVEYYNICNDPEGNTFLNYEDYRIPEKPNFFKANESFVRGGLTYCGYENIDAIIEKKCESKTGIYSYEVIKIE